MAGQVHLELYIAQTGICWNNLDARVGVELELQQEIDDANVEKYKFEHSEELEHQRQAAERDQQEIAYVTETEAAWRQSCYGDAQKVQGYWNRRIFYASEDEDGG